MNGTIEWYEPGSRMNFSGVVKYCYRNGDWMCVVCTCSGYGYGELAIPLASGRQHAVCKYTTDDWKTITEPLVSGTLLWQPDSAVFTGTWFDATLELEASDVVITVTDCDLGVSSPAPASPRQLIGEGIRAVEAIVDNLSSHHLTAWQAGNTLPQHPGIYALQWPVDQNRGTAVRYALWDGVDWFGETESIEELAEVHLGWRLMCEDVTRSWMGLTKRGSRLVMLKLARRYRSWCERALPRVIADLDQSRKTLMQNWDNAYSHFHILREAAEMAHQFDPASRRLLKKLDFEVLRRDFLQVPVLDIRTSDVRPPETMYEQLIQAQVSCNEQLAYWHEYWNKRLSLADVEGSSASSVVDWSKWLEKFNGAGWVRAHGSYGTVKS